SRDDKDCRDLRSTWDRFQYRPQLPPGREAHLEGGDGPHQPLQHGEQRLAAPGVAVDERGGGEQGGERRRRRQRAQPLGRPLPALGETEEGAEGNALGPARAVAEVAGERQLGEADGSVTLRSHEADGVQVVREDLPPGREAEAGGGGLAGAGGAEEEKGPIAIAIDYPGAVQHRSPL